MASISKELFVEIKNKFQAGVSLRSLGDEYGINRKLLSKRLQEDGVYTGKEYSDAIMDEVIERFNRGEKVFHIAREMNLDKHIVANRLDKMGIREKGPSKISSKQYLSTSATKEIASKYVDGRSVQELADEYNRSTNYIWNVVKQEDVIDSNRIFRKWYLNEDIFENIDTEEKAYWLGFLYADGYVCSSDRYSLELTLKLADKSHIEKFLNFLQSDAPILVKEVTLDGKTFMAARTTVSSKKLVIDLSAHGCHQAKSLTLEFPHWLNDELRPHFMRGYFDGDGSVSIVTIKRNYGLYYALSFGYVGSGNFFDEYEQALADVGISKVKRYPTGQAWQVTHDGNKKAKKFFDYLYENSTIYLDRKYDIFVAVFSGDTEDYNRGKNREGLTANPR